MNLDVKLEKRIDDYWNIDGSRDLSDPWTGFTQFTLLEEKTFKRIYVVRGESDKKALNIQARSFMSRTLYEIEKNAKLSEKQKWSVEKSNLDNARKVRGIYFIDTEDKDFKETFKNARKKSETPMAPAMLCKTCKRNKNGETRSKTNFKCKIPVYLWTHWIQENANGRIFTESSWRPHCRKSEATH